jgi:rod shape determining protein RodA
MKRRRFHDIDWWLLGLALTLCALGVLEIYSTTGQIPGTPLASEYKRQIHWVLIGCAASLLVSQVDYHRVVDRALWFYVLTIVCLVAVLVANHRIAGARRWLHLGAVTFQVSEMAKLVIIVCVAAYLGERRGGHIGWLDLVKLATLAGIPAVLVAVEPDLGTALTFIPVVAVGAWMAGIRFRQAAALLLLGVVMLPVGWHWMKPYQRERILSFTHPSQDVQGSGYQVTQSKIAIGAGGFWGRGLGKGTQSRLGFIPVSHADFIFAAFAEEQGFLGTLLVFLLYFILLLRLLESAQLAGDRPGAFLTVGLAAVLFFQVAVNTGMMIGFLPTTGIPLPLMTQGGSSVLFTFLGLGLAMGVRVQRFVN